MDVELKNLHQWVINNGYLEINYKFNDFMSAIGFMGEVSIYANEYNHHPEWSNVYNKIHIKLTTHDMGGITKLDIQLANNMNSIYMAKYKNEYI